MTERARGAGLDGDRLEDLVLAVNELITNTLRHAGGRGVVRTWTDGGTCRGLWIVNHLCDLVQLRSWHAGTVVRVHMALA